MPTTFARIDVTLTAAALLAAPVAVLAPKGFTPLLLLVAAVLMVQAWACGALGRAWRGVDRRMGVALSALAVCAVLSASWSDQPMASFTGALSLAGVMVAGLVAMGASRSLVGEGRRRVELALAVGTGLTMIGLAAMMARAHLTSGNDYVLQMAQSRHSRGLIVTSVLLWPAVLALGRRNRVLALALAVLGMAVIWAGGTAAAKLGLLAGLGIGLAGAVAPRLAGHALGVGVVAMIVAAPLIALRIPSPQETADRWPSLSSSALHRTVIWGFTARQIAERPLLGWGFEASRWIPGADDEIAVAVRTPGREGIMTVSQLPLHPHNAPLQWWLELGVPGAVIIAFALVRLVGLVAGIADLVSRAMAFTTTGAVLGVINVSFGAWQKWWLAALWLLAVFVAALARSDGSPLVTPPRQTLSSRSS